MEPMESLLKISQYNRTYDAMKDFYDFTNVNLELAGK